MRIEKRGYTGGKTDNGAGAKASDDGEATEPGEGEEPGEASESEETEAAIGAKALPLSA